MDSLKTVSKWYHSLQKRLNYADTVVTTDKLINFLKRSKACKKAFFSSISFNRIHKIFGNWYQSGITSEDYTIKKASLGEGGKGKEKDRILGASILI